MEGQFLVFGSQKFTYLIVHKNLKFVDLCSSFSLTLREKQLQFLLEALGAQLWIYWDFSKSLNAYVIDKAWNVNTHFSVVWMQQDCDYKHIKSSFKKEYMLITSFGKHWPLNFTEDSGHIQCRKPYNLN